MGEDYVSKAFPSNEIIIKALKRWGVERNVEKIIGKYQDKDGRYHVFYKLTQVVRSMELIKLDTDVWIYFVQDGSDILQK